jgi:hypothetical protein
MNIIKAILKGICIIWIFSLGITLLLLPLFYLFNRIILTHEPVWIYLTIIYSLSLVGGVAGWSAFGE